MCDMQLKQIENDKEFELWSATSDIYNDMKRFAHNKQKEKILKMIFTSSRERWFLLKLKAKFAGISLHLLQLARLKCEIIIRKQLSSFSEIVSLPEFSLDDFLSLKLTFSSSDVVTSEYEEDPTTTSVCAHSDGEYDSI